MFPIEVRPNPIYHLAPLSVLTPLRDFIASLNIDRKWMYLKNFDTLVNTSDPLDPVFVTSNIFDHYRSDQIFLVSSDSIHELRFLASMAKKLQPEQSILLMVYNPNIIDIEYLSFYFAQLLEVRIECYLVIDNPHITENVMDTSFPEWYQSSVPSIVLQPFF